MRLSTALILVIISLILVHTVYAIDPIISADYFTGDYIAVANDTYLIIGTDSDGSYWNNYSSVIFKHNITKNLFKVGKGKCMNTEYYTYCFNDSYYNWDEKFTYQGSILEPSLMIRVFYYNPEVTLETPEKLELEYGSGNIMKLEFKNTGSKETLVKYSEQLPAEFAVQNCNLCTITNNRVTADIRLNDGEEKTISYYIQYYGYNNFSWTTNYNYSYDDKFKSESKTTSSTVKIPYNVIESLARSVSTELGDISTFSVNITNTQEYSSLKVNISIHNQVVKNYNGLTKNNNSYYYEGVLGSSESKTFSIILDSYLVGEFPIYVDTKLEAHNNVFKYVQNHSFNVSLNPLSPSLVVDKEIVDSNDTINLLASLKNTDESAQYLYVYAHLLPQDEHWTFTKINPGKELILYNKTFPIPEDDDDLYIILSGLYRTTNFQEQTFKIVKIIDVAGREPKILNWTINETTNETVNQSGQNTPQENTEQTTSDPEAQQADTETSIIESDDVETEEEKDFLTSIIESIDSFIRGIFGKK